MSEKIKKGYRQSQQNFVSNDGEKFGPCMKEVFDIDNNTVLEFRARLSDNTMCVIDYYDEGKGYLIYSAATPEKEVEKVFRVSGELFAGEKGLVFDVDEFDVLGESDEQIVIKEQSFTVLRKQDTDLFTKVGDVEFKPSYEVGATFKAVLYWKGDKDKGVAKFKQSIIDKIESEIEERESYKKSVYKA